MLALAVKENAGLEKIRLLIKHGADLNYRSFHGYTLLTHAACADRMDALDLLLAAGAPADGESSYKESALSVLSRIGRFGQIAKLLARGADPTPLDWTPLLRAVALGSLREMEILLDEGADPEATDFWERSALLLSIHTGDTDKAALLLACGANRLATGRCGQPPAHYPIAHDDTRMMQWLIEQGFDVNQADEFGNTPVMEAAEQSATGCFRMLTEAGADWRAAKHHGEPLISQASHPEIIKWLYERGENLADLDHEVLRDFIGLGTSRDLLASEREYLDGRFRKFGNANPERMRVPFWNTMVRCGWTGYQAAKQFGDSSYGRHHPVWCHDRFGMSLTRLPDGRWIQIAGEHEDHYDPDVCIYNDVFIHDGKGGFEILGYPEDEFQPTDFHSATHIPPWIYIIGNLGYTKTREACAYQTPVYRLHTGTGTIEHVTTHGPTPGWIHRHRATFEKGCIRVSGGKIAVPPGGDNPGIHDHTAVWLLELDSLTWRNDRPGEAGE